MSDILDDDEFLTRELLHLDHFLEEEDNEIIDILVCQEILVQGSCSKLAQVSTYTFGCYVLYPEDFQESFELVIFNKLCEDSVRSYDFMFLEMVGEDMILAETLTQHVRRETVDENTILAETSTKHLINQFISIKVFSQSGELLQTCQLKIEPPHVSLKEVPGYTDVGCFYSYSHSEIHLFSEPYLFISCAQNSHVYLYDYALKQIQSIDLRPFVGHIDRFDCFSMDQNVVTVSFFHLDHYTYPINNRRGRISFLLKDGQVKLQTIG